VDKRQPADRDADSCAIDAETIRSSVSVVDRWTMALGVGRCLDAQECYHPLILLQHASILGRPDSSFRRYHQYDRKQRHRADLDCSLWRPAQRELSNGTTPRSAPRPAADSFLAPLQHALVWVKAPSFLHEPAAGKRKTSVSSTSARSSPCSISGESRPNVAARFRPSRRRTAFNFDSDASLEHAVCRSHRWVLAHHEHASFLRRPFCRRVFEEGMMLVNLGTPVVAKIVFSAVAFLP